MIFVGIDDTDTLEDPGTNQLARHLAWQLAATVRVRLITRHQLLQDPRVPCTRKNGCAALACESLSGGDATDLAGWIEPLMRSWCPSGSDPGLAIVADPVPEDVVAHGLACQTRIVTQAEARGIAARHGIHLVGLGGTEDGVIGALAAIGLMQTGNDGRVVYLGDGGADRCEVSGVVEVEAILARGVGEVRGRNGQPVTAGRVDLGKRLRPNYRGDTIVLFVAPSSRPDCEWVAERIC